MLPDPRVDRLTCESYCTGWGAIGSTECGGTGFEDVLHDLLGPALELIQLGRSLFS